MAGPVLLMPDAILRCELIAAATSIRLPTVLGAMTLIWNRSQALHIELTTKAQIGLWGCLQSDEIDLFVNAALNKDIHFLESVKGGRFRIVGNKAELKKKSERSEVKTAAANIRWNNYRKKIKEKADAGALHMHSTCNAESIPAVMPNTYTKQQRAARTKTGADAPDPSPLLQRAGITRIDSATDSSTPPDIKGGDVWKAYEAAYFNRYHVLPVRNARSNSLCKQLITRLGGDGAIGVVKFFVAHPQQYYAKVCHDLGACVKDAEGLHTQMRNGSRVTNTAAHLGDRSGSNAESARGAVEILRAGNGDPFDLRS